jgi:hypothetical protein
LPRLVNKIVSKFAREDDFRDFLISEKITMLAVASNLIKCTICSNNHDNQFLESTPKTKKKSPGRPKKDGFYKIIFVCENYFFICENYFFVCKNLNKSE